MENILSVSYKVLGAPDGWGLMRDTVSGELSHHREVCSIKPAGPVLGKGLHVTNTCKEVKGQSYRA